MDKELPAPGLHSCVRSGPLPPLPSSPPNQTPYLNMVIGYCASVTAVTATVWLPHFFFSFLLRRDGSSRGVGERTNKNEKHWDLRIESILSTDSFISISWAEILLYFRYRTCFSTVSAHQCMFVCMCCKNCYTVLLHKHTQRRTKMWNRNFSMFRYLLYMISL